MNPDEWHEKRREICDDLRTLLDCGLDKKSADQLIEIITAIVRLELEKPNR